MTAILSAILRFIAAIVEWVVEFFVWLAVKVFELIAGAVIAVLNAIPVPDFMSDISVNLSAIDPGIMYFVSPLQLGTGLSWMVTAYILRFLIRRIPVVG